MNVQGNGSLLATVYARSLAPSPRASGPKRRKRSTGSSRRRRSSSPRREPTAAGSPAAQDLLQRARPPCRGAAPTRCALIHDSTADRLSRRISAYAELLHEVQALGAIMQDFGVAKGDRVILYMPMVPEAVVAMLACARIGAVHSVVFGGFAAKELATRIDDAQPKLILSASCGIEPGRIVHTSRCSTRRSSWPAASRRPASCCSVRSSSAT